MPRRRLSRTLFAFVLFTVLFVCGCGAMLVSTSRAQEAGKPATQKQAGTNAGTNKEKGGEKTAETDPEETPAQPKDLAPTGPDELFTPLSEAGLFEGSVPEHSYKAVILLVPNPDSHNDQPTHDLTTSERYVAGGFLLMLEQQLDYLPQVHVESDAERVRRNAVRLRQGDAPRAGTKAGARSLSLDAQADCFDSDLVFAVSFAPAEGETPARGAAFRYSKQNGVERAVEWDIGKLATPEPDSTVKLLEGKVNALCAGIGATKAEDGSPVEVPHAPIPRLVTEDKAMRDFVKLREGLENGDAARAWLAFDSLMKRDPRCGRAALYAMEVFRALASTQSVAEENAKYLKLAMEVGREGVRLCPNDVLLRGRLCWIGLNFFNRFGWARTGLKQAMRVQPASYELMGWWLMCYEVEQPEKRVQWLIDNGLPVVKDGRIELTLGNLYYGIGDYTKGIEWYQKGVTVAPRNFELQMSLGLCANYEGERFARQRQLRESTDAFATSSEALAAAMQIDPQAIKWVYEYYVRATTHKFERLPTNPKTLERLFLTQAALNGLTENRRTGQWDELVKDVVKLERPVIRDLCRDAKPDDPLYVVKLIARLQFDLVAQDTDDLIATLWGMRETGLRPEIYTNLMGTYGPVVDEYKPPKIGDSDG